MPYKHQALSAEFFTPFGRIEGHTVHVLPGSQYGETKTEMFRAIHERLAVEDPPDYRFLCGDFNSPKEESDDGEVTVWGSDEGRIEAERSVMVDLAAFDLTDAYRDVNGYGDDAYSWVAENRGSKFPDGSITCSLASGYTRPRRPISTSTTNSRTTRHLKSSVPPRMVYTRMSKHSTAVPSRQL